jgi:hypothetical protein
MFGPPGPADRAQGGDRSIPATERSASAVSPPFGDRGLPRQVTSFTGLRMQPLKGRLPTPARTEFRALAMGPFRPTLT